MTNANSKHYRNCYSQDCHTFGDKTGPTFSLPEPYFQGGFVFLFIGSFQEGSLLQGEP